MARCEDFPCCGHEAGCCPDFDENGNQLNMICVCGAKLPVNNKSSCCSSCLRDPDDESNECDICGAECYGRLCRECCDEDDVDEAQEWHDYDPDC